MFDVMLFHQLVKYLSPSQANKSVQGLVQAESQFGSAYELSVFREFELASDSGIFGFEDSAVLKDGLGCDRVFLYCTDTLAACFAAGCSDELDFATTYELGAIADAVLLYLVLGKNWCEYCFIRPVMAWWLNCALDRRPCR